MAPRSKSLSTKSAPLPWLGDSATGEVSSPARAERWDVQHGRWALAWIRIGGAGRGGGKRQGRRREREEEAGTDLGFLNKFNGRPRSPI